MNFLKIKKNKLKLKTNNGFTIVEMLVAVGIFMSIAVISAGATLSLMDVNRKAQQVKVALDNISLISEEMTREIRTGRRYHCGIVGEVVSPTNPQDCINGGNFLRFKTARGDDAEYFLLHGVIQKRENIGQANERVIPLTVFEDIEIIEFNLYVGGSEDAPNLQQPFVLVHIKGGVGGAGEKTEINFQTTATQRF